MLRTISIGLCLLLLNAGCAPDMFEGSLPPGLPCDPTSPGGADPVTGVSFDADTMLCVGFEMDEKDFRRMSRENRFGRDIVESFESLLSTMAANCLKPWPDDFDWYTADMTIGGLAVDQVGIRKKGFLGSVVGLGMKKPSIKIKTDRYVPEQFLGVTERLTLNNMVQDDSRMVACLTYDLFAAAGYPAPLCNMANVMVNGEPMGAYAHVESIKVRFLERAFGDPTGSLYEGAILDLIEGFMVGIPEGELGRWEAKTDATDPTGQPLLDLYEALQAPDETLEETLEGALNLDRFITFWAMEVLVRHNDGYSQGRNNYYIYFDPTDGNRAVFIPWGADEVFQGKGQLKNYLSAELPRRLSRIPELAGRMEAELVRLLEEIWDEETILASVDRYSDQVRTAQAGEDYDLTVEKLRTWVTERRQVLQDQLAEGFPEGKPEPDSCAEGMEDLILILPDLLATFTFAW